MMEDAAIVGLYWQRDPRAIEETDRKYGGYCRAIAQRICQSRDDGEECVNDTWLSAWNAMPDKRPDRLSPFLGRIVRNHALHRVEAAGRLKRGGGETALCLEELADCVAGTGSAEALLEQKELAAVIRQKACARPCGPTVFSARSRKKNGGSFWPGISICCRCRRLQPDSAAARARSRAACSAAGRSCGAHW